MTLNGATSDVATFVAPTGASTDLTFELTTASAGGLSTAKTQVGVHVQSGAAPVANAGADQNAIVETQITLDGTSSLYATSYAWTQTGGPMVTLNGANMSIASFEMPNSNTPLTFTLTAKAGTTTSTDTVVITKKQDIVTITRAEYRARGGSLRVDGTSSLFSVPNVVSIYLSDGVAGTHPVKAIGTIIADPTLGDYSFRIDSGVVLPANAKLDIYTSRGGVLENVAVTFK